MMLFVILSCSKLPWLPVNPGGVPIWGQAPGGGTPTDSIVYTNVDPDSLLLGFDTSYLDLNKDGRPDFIFQRHSYEELCSDDLLGLFGDYTSLTIAPASGQDAVMIDGSYARALDSGTLILPDSNWAISGQVLILGGVGGSGHCLIAGGVRGNWWNLSDKYLGLRMTKGNNFYYGWARLTSTYSIKPNIPFSLVPGALILKDYAYNKIPGRPLYAGQMH